MKMRFLLFCILFLFQFNVFAALTFGVHPFVSKLDLESKFDPLLTYLSEHIDEPITLNIADDYDDHIVNVGLDKVDIAFVGPVSYVRMVKKYGKKPLLVKTEVNGESTFKGVIFSKKSSDINTLEDIRGKTVAFGDINSTMSHIAPRFTLLQAGINTEDLENYDFLGNHERVAFSVLLGQYDVGTIKQSIFNKYERQGLKLIAYTPAISNHIFVTSQHLAPEKVEKLRTLMLSLNENDKSLSILNKIKKSITGVQSADDKDYDNLREILQTLLDSQIIRQF